MTAALAPPPGRFLGGLGRMLLSMPSASEPVLPRFGGLYGLQGQPPKLTATNAQDSIEWKRVHLLLAHVAATLADLVVPRQHQTVRIGKADIISKDAVLTMISRPSWFCIVDQTSKMLII